MERWGMVESSVNRFDPFVQNELLRAMFGQTGHSLDLGRALDRGYIILVSAATRNAKVAEEDAKLLATLLLSDVWTAAKERGKRGDVKPFYLYLDEFQEFVTPTFAKNGLSLRTSHCASTWRRSCGSGISTSPVSGSSGFICLPVRGCVTSPLPEA